MVSTIPRVWENNIALIHKMDKTRLEMLQAGPLILPIFTNGWSIVDSSALFIVKQLSFL